MMVTPCATASLRARITSSGDPCAKKANAAQTLKAKKKLLADRRAGRRKKGAEARDLGPARPELGMTPAEYFTWRDGKFVELHLREGLSVGALAERFGCDVGTVRRALNREGLVVRTGEGFLLPAGLPVL